MGAVRPLPPVESFALAVESVVSFQKNWCIGWRIETVADCAANSNTFFFWPTRSGKNGGLTLRVCGKRDEVWVCPPLPRNRALVGKRGEAGAETGFLNRVSGLLFNAGRYDSRPLYFPPLKSIAQVAPVMAKSDG